MVGWPIIVAGDLRRRWGAGHFSSCPSSRPSHPLHTRTRLPLLCLLLQVGKFSFMANSRARTVEDTEGLVKFVSDAKTDKILGCSIMGPNAGEGQGALLCKWQWAPLKIVPCGTTNNSSDLSPIIRTLSCPPPPPPPPAGELIPECVLAMEYGAATEDIARTCHGHPTLSEAIKEAALATYFKPIHS